MELRAALKNYFDTLYAAGMDPAGKTDELAQLITPRCSCRSVLDVLRQEAAAGLHLDYSYRLTEIKVVSVGALGGDVTYVVHRSAGAERDAAGHVRERFAATTYRYSAHFQRDGDHWLLDQVARYRS